ncbi:hypothetical protein CMU89_07180 [Elizabethkingia anophelis]|uniref:Uncharacterized protein n=1 Tax=Elizabethkingia anophelis TaxID=1117645 RepID=A0A455ZHR0_9FLAO|nr:hypothetical protein [Elizabethkingia anophelis]AQW92939.1 hypothetical protein BBD30_01395 [Elizabethkingia anophelis]MDV3507016.1 hypothetical protein [Elizabethkingia anophelis]MDV3542438.1 hypothetical protein [Elizabethkingia anophelis]OPB61449.1 hypothetical protein BAS07_16865 [Elizabethkingia anophelis]DAC76397.1 TPA_exp: hypothetical protein [Elizabethkingia anophelis]
MEIDWTEKYWKQIENQGFRNEHESVMVLEWENKLLSSDIHHQEKYDFWEEGMGHFIFDFLQGADKFNIGEIVDITFIECLFDVGVIERSFEKDFNTSCIKIIGKKYFYDPVEYDDNFAPIYPLKSSKPRIFYKVTLESGDSFYNW